MINIQRSCELRESRPQLPRQIPIEYRRDEVFFGVMPFELAFPQVIPVEGHVSKEVEVFLDVGEIVQLMCELERGFEFRREIFWQEAVFEDLIDDETVLSGDFTKR